MTDGGVFSWESVQLLLNNGVNPNVRDNTGCTVILYVAFGHGRYPYLALLDALLVRDDISREDKIDALEMAGAVLLRRYGGREEVALAFRYWRQALTLRLLKTEDNLPIYKTPLKSANESLKEWSTEEDLLLLEQDPSQHEMQSLLVLLRIFSGLGWRAVHEHVFHYIQRFLFKELKSDGAISQALGISWVMFDTVLRSDRPYESDLCSTLLKFSNRLMSRLNHLPKDGPNFSSNNLQQIVEILIMADTLYFTDTNNPEAPAVETRRLTNLLAMVKILLSHPEMMTENVRLPLVQLFHRDSRDSSGRSLLLYTCYEIYSDYTLPAIRLLVQLGADLNARDNKGRGVFHFLVETTWNLRDASNATARLLLDLGAHLDLADNQGRTAADLWLAKNFQLWQQMPDWLQEGVPKLKCLSSRVIRRHRLPYEDNNVLPAVLIPYVSWH